MRKFTVGLMAGLLNVPALFLAAAHADRDVAPAALPVDSPIPTLAEMALGLTRGLPLGDLTGGLPVLGETASVLSGPGGTDVATLPGLGDAGCKLPTADALETVNGTLGDVTGIAAGLPLVGSLLGSTTGGGLLGSAVATVNGLVETAPLAAEIAAQATC